ncbi:MAG: IncP plasmid survival protein KfrC family protein [Syntrophobacteraceae bacterium]
MTTPKVPDINVENLDSQHDNRIGAATDLGNDLLEQAQEAQSQQAALLESTPLESRYNGALANYVQEKQEQVERLQDRLENLIEKEMANLESCQAHRPAGLFLRPGARGAWQREQTGRQATIQRMQNRLEHVREIKAEMGFHGPKIEELAIRKLRLKESDLAGEWDDMRTAQRNHDATERQKIEQPPRFQSLSRVRSLNVVTE